MDRQFGSKHLKLIQQRTGERRLGECFSKLERGNIIVWSSFGGERLGKLLKLDVRMTNAN